MKDLGPSESCGARLLDLAQPGQWHGEPGLLPPGRYREASSFIPFTPADEDLLLAGRVLTIRYGEVAEESKVSRKCLGSSRASAAITARSAQSGFGRVTRRRRTATSCRKIKISTS